jgi:hypothetical protein
MSCAFSARHPTPQSALRQIKKNSNFLGRVLLAEKRLSSPQRRGERRDLAERGRERKRGFILFSPLLFFSLRNLWFCGASAVNCELPSTFGFI